MKKGKLIWYWDYELQIAKDLASEPIRCSLGYTPEEEVDNTNFMLKKCKSTNIRFCFSVVGRTILNNKMPYSNLRQVRKMHANNHEIACHTFDHIRLSTSSYNEVYNDIKKCKNLMKEKLNIDCLSLTAPWNKPQHFFTIDFDINPAMNKFKFNVLSTKEICNILRLLDFRYYRLPCYSFNKVRLSKPRIINDITCIPIFMSCWINNNTFNLIKKAIEKKGLVVLGNHPLDLSFKGEKDKFNTLFDFVNEQVNKDKLEVILPRDV